MNSLAAPPAVVFEHVSLAFDEHVVLRDVNFSVLFKMMSELRRHHTAELLPTISVPVLVLAGRKDVFTPPSVQQIMADVIPGAEIVWWEEAGHMLPIEEPEELTAAILDFATRRFP